MKNRLTIAIQKGERMSEPAVGMLGRAGIKIEKSPRRLVAEKGDIKLAFLRGPDIPCLLDEGVVDAAIIGSNEIEEAYLENPARRKYLLDNIPLGISPARISLAGPLKRKTDYDLSDAKAIATSYPNIAREYLLRSGIIGLSRNRRTTRPFVNVIFLSGAVEAAPELGMADYIIDIVESGGTLAENGLAEFDKIMDTQGVLVSRRLEAYQAAIFRRIKEALEDVGQR
ncbi:MAG: ATP phosphoribosyltransferase [Rickettsiales bacterium]|jgi:ATP phosphoribosyltransferase|nr:ATP phosphoribosyltransferase [Rickettsiales bacterium]